MIPTSQEGDYGAYQKIVENLQEFEIKIHRLIHLAYAWKSDEFQTKKLLKMMKFNTSNEGVEKSLKPNLVRSEFEGFTRCDRKLLLDCRAD